MWKPKDSVTIKACDYKSCFWWKTCSESISHLFFPSRINSCWSGNGINLMRSVVFYPSLQALPSLHPQDISGSVSAASKNPQQHFKLGGRNSFISQFPCLTMDCSQFKILSHFRYHCIAAMSWESAVLPMFALNSREKTSSSFCSSIKRAVVCVMPCLPACSLWVWDSLYHNTVSHLRNTHLGMKRIVFSLGSDCLSQHSFVRHISYSVCGSLQMLWFLGLSHGGWKEAVLVCIMSLFRISLTILCHGSIKAVKLHQ